ncbi:PREDICTED: protein Flattop-like [Ceratosolen solmsi marchali]|uniref:Cilia- and flagella-associated protein 126 n=1 Tax=Ceratosolen solmsi marchali TaxID=326594 RepID=A0AAJ6YIL2_9HYME|nr:PREDICTED: protein Flattop-like [Ceratosolen solmsi marchali]
MSQFWHAHWAEDSFKSTRLQNWEVPRQHAEWPRKHCTTTKFIAYLNGHLYIPFKTRNVIWSNFKGTWELPLKIDRRTAEILSKSTEDNNISWNIHNKQYEHLIQNSNKCKNKENKVKAEKHKE